MRCPFCKKNNDKVVDSRKSPDELSIRRRRECVECGKRFKQVSKSHLTSHGLTPKEYKEKHGISLGQALVSKDLSAKRRKVAKEKGLGK